MKWVLLILILNSDATRSEMNSLTFDSKQACQLAAAKVADWNTVRGVHVRTICIQRTSLISEWQDKKGEDL